MKQILITILVCLPMYSSVINITPTQQIPCAHDYYVNKGARIISENKPDLLEKMFTQATLRLNNDVSFYAKLLNYAAYINRPQCAEITVKFSQMAQIFADNQDVIIKSLQQDNNTMLYDALKNISVHINQSNLSAFKPHIETTLKTAQTLRAGKCILEIYHFHHTVHEALKLLHGKK